MWSLKRPWKMVAIFCINPVWSLLLPPRIGVFCFVSFLLTSLFLPHFMNTWNKLHTFLITGRLLCGKDSALWIAHALLCSFVACIKEVSPSYIWQKPDDMRSSHSRVNADDVIEQIFSGWVLFTIFTFCEQTLPIGKVLKSWDRSSLLFDWFYLSIAICIGIFDKCR